MSVFFHLTLSSLRDIHDSKKHLCQDHRAVYEYALQGLYLDMFQNLLLVTWRKQEGISLRALN